MASEARSAVRAARRSDLGTLADLRGLIEEVYANARMGESLRLAQAVPEPGVVRIRVFFHLGRKRIVFGDGSHMSPF